MNKYFVVFAFIVAVSSNAVRDPLERIFWIGETWTVNDQVDNIIPAISQFIRENDLDPMPSPDLSDGFSYQPLWVTYRGQLYLSRGTVTNLQSIRRSGDALFAHLNNLYRFRTSVAFNELGFNYDYKATLMDIGPSGGVIATMDKASLEADILYDKNFEEYHIQSFGITDVGSLRIRLTGNFLTDWFVNPVMSLITTLFKTYVMGEIEDAFRRELQKYIDQLNSGEREINIPDFFQQLNKF